MKLLLASQSPRRQALLAQLGYDFETVAIDADESYPQSLPPKQVAAYISAKKAQTLCPKKDEILLTADTVVALGQEILLKPKDEAEARAMLRNMSARPHFVYTAFTLKTAASQTTRTSATTVEFGEMDGAEIDHYVRNCRPLDKAGSYGIQEWLGMAKVQKLSGSYYAVMGLPADLVYEELKKLHHLPKNFEPGRHL